MISQIDAQCHNPIELVEKCVETFCITSLQGNVWKKFYRKVLNELRCKVSPYNSWCLYDKLIGKVLPKVIDNLRCMFDYFFSKYFKWFQVAWKIPT